MSKSTSDGWLPGIPTPVFRKVKSATHRAAVSQDRSGRVLMGIGIGSPGHVGTIYVTWELTRGQVVGDSSNLVADVKSLCCWEFAHGGRGDMRSRFFVGGPSKCLLG